MKRLVYTPFSIVFGILGSVIGRKAFKAIWERVSDEPKPSATEPDASLGRVAASAALEGATLAAAAAVAGQLSARAFHYIFGVWPMKARKQPAAESD